MKQIVLSMENTRPLVRELTHVWLGKAQVSGVPITEAVAYQDESQSRFWEYCHRMTPGVVSPGPQLTQVQTGSTISKIQPLFDWCVFTSARTIPFFRKFWSAQIAKLNARPDTLPSPTDLSDAIAQGLLGKVATVGDRSAQATRNSGFPVDLVGLGSAKRLLEVFPFSPGSILLPGSALRQNTLKVGLQARKARTILELNLYTMQPVPTLPPAYQHADLLVITSGSAARALSDLSFPSFTSQTGRSASNQVTAKIICLGHPTALVCRQLGFKVDAVANHPDAAGLNHALAPYLKQP